MFVSPKTMIETAQKEGYAVPAFNAENLEMVQAIILAAEETHSPVIIQTTASTVKYLTEDETVAMVKTMAEKSPVPVALHLDHCSDFQAVMRAVKAGYTSVMFDGSKLPFAENLAITQKVVEAVHPMGLTVEAELGAIGGKEDNVESEAVVYTDVEEAKTFAKESGVDFFAVAIGTAHGFYKGEPKLDFDRMDTIAKETLVPLVLHGGSGVPDESVKKAISLGMCKVNFATELRAAATVAVREVLKDNTVIDPKKYMGAAREAVKALCIEKIKVCGSENRAL